MNEQGQITAEQIAHIKETEFLPAIRRLVLLGLLLIKLSAPVQWFSIVIDLLIEVFDASHKLRRTQAPLPNQGAVTSLGEHQSYTVPALEALLAVYLLASYALVTRGKHQYLRALFPRIVNGVRGPDEDDYRSFLLFWPLTFYWGTPDVRRDLLVADRYSRADRIEQLMGGASRLKAGVLQVDCLVDWHSVLAQRPPEGEPETHNLFEKKYPAIYNWYGQNFTRENLTNVMPLVGKLWDMATGGNDDLFLDPDLGKILIGYEPEKRKQILAKFLLYAERDHRDRLWHFRVYWQPNELNVLVKALQRPE